MTDQTELTIERLWALIQDYGDCRVRIYNDPTNVAALYIRQARQNLRSALQEILTVQAAQATGIESTEPGTARGRMQWLMSELETRFPHPTPFSSVGPPEQHYIAAIDRLREGRSTDHGATEETKDLPFHLTESEQKRLVNDPRALSCLLDYHDEWLSCMQSTYESGEQTTGNERRIQEIRERGRAIMSEDLDIWENNLRRDFGFPEAPMHCVETNRPMVDTTPPATARDRWMYEQGRLAERDPRTEGSAGAKLALLQKEEQAKCPHCDLPAAPGWTPEQVRIGHRWENGVKTYHCHMAAD